MVGMTHVTQVAGVAETARILGKSRATVKRWAADGTIPAGKLPGKTGAYLFDRAAIQALAAERVRA